MLESNPSTGHTLGATSRRLYRRMSLSLENRMLLGMDDHGRVLAAARATTTAPDVYPYGPRRSLTCPECHAAAVVWLTVK